jgi:DNA (cytosine-5)-methyltransferase 1
MSAHEVVSIIVQARREGVTLFAKADGKLGWKGAQRPSDLLLAVLKEHREEILALLPLPASASFTIGPAKATVTRLQALGFRAYLDHGALLIADATGRRRDVSRYMPIAEVFDDLVAGLAAEPKLLDSYRRNEGEAIVASADISVSAEKRPTSDAPLARPLALAAAPAFLEFFAGGGMARLGLGPGWTCVLANDNDREKVRSYTANFGVTGLKVGDVAHLKPSDFPGVASLAWVSFPCQDLSEAGAGAGLDGFRSNAIWPCLRLVKALRVEGRAPRMIVLENVTGLLSQRSEKFLDAICDALAGLGYRLGLLVIDGALFVAQSRPRVFIIAVDAALPIPAELLDNGPSQPFHPPPLVAALRRQTTPALWWRLPVPPARNTALIDVVENDPPHFLWDAPAETAKKISMMDANNLAKLNIAKRAGKLVVGGLYRRTRGKGAEKRSAWEVRFDDVAGCLRMPTGGSSIQTVMIVESDSVRARRLSAREAARLMGVGDDYRLPGNYLEAYGLMADGLVVPVVRHLAAHILEPLLAANNQMAAE